MVIDWLLACITFFLAPIMPPLLVPLGFSMLGILLIKGVNPWLLASTMTVSALLTYIPLRIIEGYILDKLKSYKKKHQHPGYILTIIQSFVDFFAKKEKIHTSRTRIEEYIGTRHGKMTVFLIAVICAAPTIPDIITVSLFRKRMPFWMFMFAGLIGKIISFFPFVFLGKGILDLIFD